MVARGGIPPEYALYKMSNAEISAILEEVNEIELNKIRQLRTVCYYQSLPYMKEQISIEQFWELPGDKEIEGVEPITDKEKAVAEKLCKILSNGR